MEQDTVDRLWSERGRCRFPLRAVVGIMKLARRYVEFLDMAAILLGD